MSRPTAIVYVDGFNFYYGLVQGTPHKWLNYESLFDHLLSGYEVRMVKYYTARVKLGANPADPAAPDRQKAYLNALITLPRVQVVEGNFNITKTRARRRYKAKWLGFIPVPRRLRERHWVPIWKVEEKGSDVNLGAQFVLDAAMGAADLYLVVTSDSDLVEPIRIAADTLGRDVALITPHELKRGELLQQRIKFRLWISDGALAAHQLPNPVTHQGKTYYKPETW